MRWPCLLPYGEMLAEWEKARAEKVHAIEQQRRQEIKNLRAEIRKTRAEMKERGIKRTSCFNRVDGDTYRFNATMFQLETRLKSLLVANDEGRQARLFHGGSDKIQQAGRGR